MTDEIAYSSAHALAERLRNKELGVVELCDLSIERIERLDKHLNAVVVRDFERAREAAKAMDNTPVEQRGLLGGLPITIKESHNIAGLPTTWGMPEYKDALAQEDAEIVKRYKSAGAIFLGKTNVPINLADFQSYNEIYGTTCNPWDLERTPGGSSGGSAAALAAGLVALETGSDIGGSIRNPAHFCGVYGHKPTHGTVPPQGHALPGSVASPDIAVCGPLARSAEDLALAMSIISGTEPLDAPGWQLNLPQPQKKSLSEFKVAVWLSDEHSPVDSETQHKLTMVADVLRSSGAEVSLTARPDFPVEQSHRTYVTLLQSIMGASVPEEVFQQSKKLAAEFGPRDMSEPAILARAMAAEHRDWLRANNVREKLRYKWRDFFSQWDILLCPQMATAAFKHDHSESFSNRTITVDGEQKPYFQQVFWSGLITAPYLPSTVFPAGLTANEPISGLPIGLQAVSAEYNDYITIDFCRLLAEEMGGFKAPAMDFAQ